MPKKIAILNAISGKSRTLKSAAQAVLHETKSQQGMVYYAEKQKDYKEHYSSNKAKKLLNWEPKVTFLNGIIETIKWIKKTGPISKKYNSAIYTEDIKILNTRG